MYSYYVHIYGLLMHKLQAILLYVSGSLLSHQKLYTVNSKSYMGEKFCDFHRFQQIAKVFPINFVNFPKAKLV